MKYLVKILIRIHNNFFPIWKVIFSNVTLERNNEIPNQSNWEGGLRKDRK